MNTLEEFKTTLKEAGLTKSEFAELAGIHRSTVNTWGTNAKQAREVPQWAMVLLQYRIEALACRQTLRMMLSDERALRQGATQARR